MRISQDNLLQDEKDISVAINKYSRLDLGSKSKKLGPKVTTALSSR